MKNYIKHTIALLFVSSFAFTSCLDLTSNATDADASIENTLQQSQGIDVPLVICDFDNRKTTEVMLERNGVVKMINSPSEPDVPMFLIQLPGEAQRFVACNMPDAIKKDGMKIIFDGEVKEINPEEKWIATPMKLIKIHDMTDDSDQPIVTTSAN